jgi:LPS-assembly protein
MHPILNRFAAVALTFSLLLAARADDQPVQLRPEASIESTPKRSDEQAPLFLQSDSLEGNAEQVDARGSVELRRRGMSIFADYLGYSRERNACVADGNVRLERQGDILEGSRLNYSFSDEKGTMKRPKFQLVKRPDRRQAARGSASEVIFQGKDRDRLYSAQYTTCPAGRDDWFLRVDELELDRITQIGTAKNASVVFMNVPILYFPWMTFALNNQRKTGFLTPSFFSTGTSGLEISLPYYWNIAPNMDATLTPRYMSKRGLQLNSEFRYLEPLFSGQAEVEILPHDQQKLEDRYLLAWRHLQNFTHGWSGRLNLEKVSDDNYFRDLSTRLSTAEQVNLPREAALSYADANWNFTSRLLHYQTLQDPLALQVTPYRLKPQLVLNGTKANYHGVDLSLASEWVNFEHPTLVNGKRFIFYPSVSYPMLRSYGYLTPKLGFHVTQYSLSENQLGPESIRRSVPIFSLDSGLYYDRQVTYRGQSFQQTLEPRLFYVRIPFREQSQIPVFSTAQADFNFAQIFTENQFIGGDRINDANQLTAMLATRFLASATGVEKLRAAIGQRFYFDTQRVTLPGTPARKSKASDVLAALGGEIARNWTLDSLVQFGTDSKRAEKVSVSARFMPERGKVVNFGFRLSRDNPNPKDNVQQVDVSAQWPLSGRWYGLARVNYSSLDRKVVEGLAGLEYNIDCWSLRFGAHRFVTAEQQVTNSLFVQLELTGLSKLGINNPLEMLRQNIPGYLKSNEINQ